MPTSRFAPTSWATARREPCGPTPGERVPAAASASEIAGPAAETRNSRPGSAAPARSPRTRRGGRAGSGAPAGQTPGPPGSGSARARAPTRTGAPRRRRRPGSAGPGTRPGPGRTGTRTGPRSGTSRARCRPGCRTAGRSSPPGRPGGPGRFGRCHACHTPDATSWRGRRMRRDRGAPRPATVGGSPTLQAWVMRRRPLPPVGGLRRRRAPARSLSPSRAGDFLTCPLLYRFRVIDRLPEPPSPAAVRGTLVHAVLEHLFDSPAAAAPRRRPGRWSRRSGTGLSPRSPGWPACSTPTRTWRPGWPGRPHARPVLHAGGSRRIEPAHRELSSRRPGIRAAPARLHRPAGRRAGRRDPDR